MSWWPLSFMLSSSQPKVVWLSYFPVHLLPSTKNWFYHPTSPPDFLIGFVILHILFQTSFTFRPSLVAAAQPSTALLSVSPPCILFSESFHRPSEKSGRKITFIDDFCLCPVKFTVMTEVFYICTFQYSGS